MRRNRRHPWRLCCRNAGEGNARVFHYSARHKPIQSSSPQPLFRRLVCDGGEDADENRGRRRGLWRARHGGVRASPLLCGAGAGCRCFFSSFGGVRFGCFLFGLSLLLCGLALGAWSSAGALRWRGLSASGFLLGAGVARPGLRLGFFFFGFRASLSGFGFGGALGLGFGLASAGWLRRRASRLCCLLCLGFAFSVGAFFGVAGGGFPFALAGFAFGAGGSGAGGAWLCALILLLLFGLAGFCWRAFFSC